MLLVLRMGLGLVLLGVMEPSMVPGIFLVVFVRNILQGFGQDHEDCL